MKQIEITYQISGQRLDKFLARRLNNAPKAFIHKMLRKKNIVVNNMGASGSLKLNIGDVVTLYLSDATIEKFTKPIQKTKHIKALDIDIIYEDENIIVVNKPPNLLTQPNSPGGSSLITHLGQMHPRADFAPVAINRLDQNTTGIVLCAKNLPCAQILYQAFKERRAVKKTYMAIAHGKLTKDMRLEGCHEKDHARNFTKIVPRETMKNVPRGTIGKGVITDIYPIRYDKADDVTLLKVGLETGRSHQIRAHLAGIGHPLVGDVKYGGKLSQIRDVKYGAKGGQDQRHMLHAYKISFGKLPGVMGYCSGKSFIAELPSDMALYF